MICNFFRSDNLNNLKCPKYGLEVFVNEQKPNLLPKQAMHINIYYILARMYVWRKCDAKLSPATPQPQRYRGIFRTYTLIRQPTAGAQHQRVPGNDRKLMIDFRLRCGDVVRCGYGIFYYRFQIFEVFIGEQATPSLWI